MRIGDLDVGGADFLGILGSVDDLLRVIACYATVNEDMGATTYILDAGCRICKQSSLTVACVVPQALGYVVGGVSGAATAFSTVRNQLYWLVVAVEVVLHGGKVPRVDGFLVVMPKVVYRRPPKQFSMLRMTNALGDDVGRCPVRIHGRQRQQLCRVILM